MGIDENFKGTFSVKTQYFGQKHSSCLPYFKSTNRNFTNIKLLTPTHNIAYITNRVSLSYQNYSKSIYDIGNSPSSFTSMP